MHQRRGETDFGLWGDWAKAKGWAVGVDLTCAISPLEKNNNVAPRREPSARYGFRVEQSSVCDEEGDEGYDDRQGEGGDNFSTRPGVIVVYCAVS